MSNPSVGPIQTTVIHTGQPIWAEEKPELTDPGYYYDNSPVSSAQNSMNESAYDTMAIKLDGTTEIKPDTLHSLGSTTEATPKEQTGIIYVLQHPLQSLAHLVRWVVSQVTSWFAPKPSTDKTSAKPPLPQEPSKFLPDNMYREGRKELAKKVEKNGPIRQVPQRPERKKAFEMDPKAEDWMNGIREACRFGGATTDARKRVYACAYTLLKENKELKETNDDQALINLSQKFGKTKSRKPLPESMQPKEPSKAMNYILSEVEATKEQLRTLYNSTMRIKTGDNEVSPETEQLFNRFNPDTEVETLAEFILFTRSSAQHLKQGH